MFRQKCKRIYQIGTEIETILLKEGRYSETKLCVSQKSDPPQSQRGLMYEDFSTELNSLNTYLSEILE